MTQPIIPNATVAFIDNYQLNNLRLLLQPYIYYCLLKPWIQLFNNRYLQIDFQWLVQIMNEFIGFVFSDAQSEDLYFSSVQSDKSG
ncbi:hypothetical protein VB735_10950 [Halotia wernerae UHCC 0503]|nr:hypothetical protein [Halotia wernerae UHCC 0503]